MLPHACFLYLTLVAAECGAIVGDDFEVQARVPGPDGLQSVCGSDSEWICVYQCCGIEYYLDCIEFSLDSVFVYLCVYLCVCVCVCIYVCVVC